MPRIGFVGPSYTDAFADEEAINLFQNSVESQGAVAPGKAYGGAIAVPTKGLLGTPGTEVFIRFPGSDAPRGSVEINGRAFVVVGSKLYEIFADKTYTDRGDVAVDTEAVSIAASSIQLLIVSAGAAYCYTLSTDTLLDVTMSLAGTPGRVRYSDTYFIVNLVGTNKFQMSALLDGATWPGLQVNAVSVFPENITSIDVNHRELWVFGAQHAQPYQDTGSDNIFDVIPGTLVESGCVALNAPDLLDNSIFWLGQDQRGVCTAWRSNGYTPQRISTHAVEIDLQSYTPDQLSKICTYSMQVIGHLWWVIYIPGAQWSWVYDVTEGLWFKMAFWISENGPYESHHSWNHVYAFGKHLVGDWSQPNLYEMHMPVDNGDGSWSFVDDAGSVIRSLRRTPTVENEMQWMEHPALTIDMVTGLTPQPPFVDGDGNDRPAECMLRWSDDRGMTWSNVHHAPCGFAGEYKTRVIFWRLGRSRYRVYEWTMTDRVPRVIRDAYLGNP